ncbi:hypothetical protein ANN_00562 [Periplaneta americana]|uniref:Uncharacterized protein n=1 Tax=Periplaneta americana TaxID=6978 RepID=A0ABQ8TSU2_PERAM|nr:hypothetical protein ANN_00562 [Periplaneta americana]
MSPGSSTESYPAFAHIGLRKNPGKNLNQKFDNDDDDDDDDDEEEEFLHAKTYVIPTYLSGELLYRRLFCSEGAAALNERRLCRPPLDNNGLSGVG